MKVLAKPILGLPALRRALLMSVRTEPKVGDEAEVPETDVDWPLVTITLEVCQ